MANHHFGKFADIWKHLVVNEVLASVRPTRYAETHAGSGTYPMVADPERQYGALRFIDRLDLAPALAATPYARTLARHLKSGHPVYPGSALQAMEMLGDTATYLLCDLDPDSTQSLREWAGRLGVPGCPVAERDGMTAVRDWVGNGNSDGVTLVHIDPFDPFARQDDGPSAVELAGDIADRGHALVYWYGYSHPDERAWALSRIGGCTQADLWCGDFLLTTLGGETRSDGDLGEATTPGTGSGVVIANIPSASVDRCDDLARALVQHYEAALLPSGEPGRLDFTVHVER